MASGKIKTAMKYVDVTTNSTAYTTGVPTRQNVPLQTGETDLANRLFVRAMDADFYAVVTDNGRIWVYPSVTATRELKLRIYYQ